jgi:hypothetical protein
MRFKKILSFKVFQKKYTSLLLLLPFLALIGVIYCCYYNDPFDNNELTDISLHNSGISYQTFIQVIFLNTLVQSILITKVCINAFRTRSPPGSILF